MVMKAFGYVFVFVGIFLVLGTAGADCDGKCMENAMLLEDILLYTAIGMLMMICGTLVAVRSE